MKIGKRMVENGLKATVEAMSGVDLSRCYQCRKCTSGCPVTRLVKSPPSEIVRRLQLGAGDELLKSDLVWLCLSCETCYARCPMEINIAAVIDALRSLSVARKAARPEGKVPLFNRMFLRMVKSFGRSYDLAMIAAYKLGARNLRDAAKFPAMLQRGKMAVLPPTGADKPIVNRIFDRATAKGKAK